MPNWCQNEITVTGDEDAVKEFVEFVRSDIPLHKKCSEKFEYVFDKESGKPEMVEKDSWCQWDDEFKDTCDKHYEEFSFQKIYPMPKDLQNTASPARIMTEEEIKEWQATWEDNENFDSMGRPITQKEYDELINKYGYSNWYDWHNEHWGVKWATGDDVNMSSDVGYLQYEFDSPWGPPEPVYQALVARFPNVAIEWFYEEPDMGLTGYLPMPPASMTFTEYVKELGLR